MDSITEKAERQRKLFDYLCATHPAVAADCFGLKPGEYPAGMSRFDRAQLWFTLAHPDSAAILDSILGDVIEGHTERHLDRLSQLREANQ